MWDSLTDIIIIYASSGLALIWALFHTISLNSITLEEFDYCDEESKNLSDNTKKFRILSKLKKLVSKGANVFLFQELQVLSTIILVFGVAIFVMVDLWGQDDVHFRCYATIAFLLGSYTSISCGYIGMQIAIATNYKMTYKCLNGLAEGFKVAFQAGCIVGFATIGLSLSILLSLIIISKNVMIPVIDSQSKQKYDVLMELIAGFGLGGSLMALFSRVGGGIFTKAADFGADLIGKIEEYQGEDSFLNPAIIADNIGDNLANIQCMGSDLFGSFAESSCAALIMIANTPTLIQHDESLFYPLLISAIGIISCFFTSIYEIYFNKVKVVDQIQRALKNQLIISAVLVIILLLIVSKFSLPDQWTQIDGSSGRWYYGFMCSSMGLISGLLISYAPLIYDTKSKQPHREMVFACEQGPDLNVIFQLALGYLKSITPVILLMITVFVGIFLLGILGLALTALGMLSTLSIGLAIDVYTPISNNARAMAKLSGMSDIKILTHALNKAGNKTAASRKQFAIGNAALISLALYGTFVMKAQKTKTNPIITIEITDPYIFCSLLLGAMLPYAFCAKTMKSVSVSTQSIVSEVKRQFQDPNIKNQEQDLDYQKCIKIATNQSLKEMLFPAFLVICTPIIMGVFFHPILVAGLLLGTLLIGIQLAISMSFTGGAWDNTKKLIQTGKYIGIDGSRTSKKEGEKKRQMFEKSLIGDSIGDSKKDTSGPQLNNMVKLVAIMSLVFAESYARSSLLSEVLGIKA